MVSGTFKARKWGGGCRERLLENQARRGGDNACEFQKSLPAQAHLPNAHASEFMGIGDVAPVKCTPTKLPPIVGVEVKGWVKDSGWTCGGWDWKPEVSQFVCLTLERTNINVSGPQAYDPKLFLRRHIFAGCFKTNDEPLRTRTRRVSYALTAHPNVLCEVNPAA